MRGAKHVSKAPPDPWRFLQPWFEVLSHFMVVADWSRYDTHEVRLGREPHDWRIRFGISRDEDEDKPKQRIQHLRKTREALILTSMLAEVDYEAWLRELKRTAGLQAKPFMDLETHKLKRAFLFDFYSSEEPEKYAWELLQNVFGDENYTAQFTKDLAKLAKMAAEKGVDVYKMEPVSIAFEMTASGLTKSIPAQITNLRNVGETVSKMREIQEKHRLTQRSPRFKGVPVFSFDGIGLDLRSFQVHTALLTELRRFVEVGVHITSLSLPETAVETEDVQSEEFLSAWVSLVRTVTGHGTRIANINRLILPFWYCREPFLSSFCSALPTARGLRFVRLEKKKKDTCSWFKVEFETDEEELASSERTWAWLGWSVFHPSSSSSVEGLSLQVVGLRKEEIDILERAMEIEQDSLRYVWRGEAKMLNVSEEVSRRREVMVMKGTTLQLTDGLNNGKSIVTYESLSAIVMTEDEGSPLDVLIPGFGFCQVDQSSLQNKRPRRQRVGTTDASAALIQTPALKSYLRTFLLEVGNEPGVDDDSDDDDDMGDSDDGGDSDSVGTIDEAKEVHLSGALLARLMTLVGRQLTSLSLASTALDDNTLAACLDACPVVRNLRLRFVKLKTMQAITRFHHQGGRIRSLELHNFKIPFEVLEAFLRTVADDRNDVYRLERLCIARSWGKQYRKSTLDALKYLLEANKRLAQVQIFRAEDWIFMHGRTLPLDRTFAHFRGDIVHVPMNESSRLAFLSVLRPENASSDHGPQTQLTEEIVQSVFEFAASSGRRIVIQDRDAYRDTRFR